MAGMSFRTRLMTRRDFIHRAGRYGAGAALGALFALDLFARDDSRTFRLEGRPSDRRRKAVVLGAGVAGLAAAYQLQKAGYDVVVLEARTRTGGRNWTVRGGDEETELTGDRQKCGFAPGQYLNAGPMRISHHHATTLAYCREFGLPMVVFTNFNEAAWLHRKGQPRQRMREIAADLRGHTSELLAKVIRQNKLDTPLSSEDREKLIEYLRGEGRLSKDLSYLRSADDDDSQDHRSRTRGYTISPGADGGPGKPTTPFDLETLIKAGYASPNLFDHDLHQQPTMLAPAGGMDRLARSFEERLAGRIQLGAQVREVRRTNDGRARIHYSDGSAPESSARQIEADFCVCTLPPHLLTQLPNDFSPETLAALRLPGTTTAGKIGLQFRRRFWEEDDDIYGGRSLTNEPIGQIYYPSEDYGKTGSAVLLGSYHFANRREVFDRPPAEREKIALEQGAAIHPQYPAEFENSFSVEWHRIRHNESSWARWRSDSDFDQAMRVLGQPDGPFYFAGDWLSHLNAWQAGAFVSTHRALRELHRRAQSS